MSQQTPPLTLPSNWVEARSPTGQTYYINTTTNETQWNFPDVPPPHVVSPPPLPLGWQQLVYQGRPFYRNDATNTSQWEFPSIVLPLSSFPVQPQRQQQSLPPNWEQHLDTDQNPYYHNIVTQAWQRSYPSHQYDAAVSLFTRLLDTVFNTKIDMHTRPQPPPVMPVELNAEILTFFKDNDTFYTLVDENNLTILGYIILTNKPVMMMRYVESFTQMERSEEGRKRSQEIKTIVNRGLNEELEFILTHRVNGEVDVAAQIMQIMDAITRNIMIQLFPTFTLSQRNVELLGYLMLMANYPIFKLPDTRTNFMIPHAYRPHRFIRNGGKLKKKYKLSRRNKLYKRKGSRKHYSRRRGHRGGAMTTFNSANF